MELYIYLYILLQVFVLTFPEFFGILMEPFEDYFIVNVLLLFLLLPLAIVGFLGVFLSRKRSKNG